MIRAFLLVQLLLVGLAGCAVQRTDAAILPTGFYGPGDQNDAAMLDAQSYYAGRNLRPATPQQVARVLAAVEYLSGEVNSNDRYSSVPALQQVQMMQAREELRAALAIAPGARSQQIVDALSAASRTQTPQALADSLAQPFFTLGPQATAARLTNLPPMPITRRALDQIWTHEYRKLDAV